MVHRYVCAPPINRGKFSIRMLTAVWIGLASLAEGAAMGMLVSEIAGGCQLGTGFLMFRQRTCSYTDVDRGLS